MLEKLELENAVDLLDIVGGFGEKLMITECDLDYHSIPDAYGNPVEDRLIIFADQVFRPGRLLYGTDIQPTEGLDFDFDYLIMQARVLEEKNLVRLWQAQFSSGNRTFDFYERLTLHYLERFSPAVLPWWGHNPHHPNRGDNSRIQEIIENGDPAVWWIEITDKGQAFLKNWRRKADETRAFFEEQSKKTWSDARPYWRGDRVYHPKFGYGTVTRVEETDNNPSNDYILSINFDKDGFKRVRDSFVTQTLCILIEEPSAAERMR
jgi:hypothetical protein